MSETHKGRMIVVDDDALTRKLLQRQLHDAGYDVSAFADGRAALQSICEMGNGIVIADWSMPVMDGVELCRAVRELQDMQALGTIHLILLTAFDTKEKVVEGLAAGANDYLTKPYHLGELLARVKVGERMLRLQDELVRRNVEVQKANAQMAVLANKLEHLANTDALTGLPNRRCLFERFKDTWRTVLRDGLRLSCLVLDIDRFKRINDTYGHAAGDHVLKYVAEVIGRHTRQPELCGRFGGEEFMLIFPATPAATAALLAEELRVDVAAVPVAWENTSIPVFISCGVAERTAAMTCADDLVRDSDATLYLAKEHGRNQTWLLGTDGRGLQFGGGTAGLSVAPAEFAGHPRASPIRSRPRDEPLQCIHADSDHKR